MHKSISLSSYVKRRNGLPLGASGSLQAMLKRSFGAGSFDTFWQYWNPIWSYYLSRFVMKPLSRVLPFWLSVIVTFSVSGALHDVVVSIIKWQLIFVLTPWFTLMGLLVVTLKYAQVSYLGYRWLVRALINLSLIGTSFYLTTLFI
ncbi:acyltransferase [Psychrobium sp. 1_MG-2023]|uniref:acyltransferase n=1 Tax=Psychrobium sp. 1_MG-2023 TaxID=3062624 RepID=UPI000C326E0A|nr:acyltransferase [Psychrobium sp. 1_MG-2023]MDP2559645.1 acyltransferase [Psychrobium sp. 1_MG-2023]PKF59477.1 acyltransferase [Alteromonadales bacterium alter-6D02]